MQAIGKALYAHGFDPALTGALGAAVTVTATVLKISALAVNPAHVFIFCATTKVITNLLDYPVIWITAKLSDVKYNEREDVYEEGNRFANRQIAESFTLASRISAFALSMFTISFFAPELTVPLLAAMIIYTITSIAKALLYSTSCRMGRAIAPVKTNKHY